MRRNEMLDTVRKELDAVGLSCTHEIAGSGHIRIEWIVNGERRVYYVSKTKPSDHRSIRNSRSDVRRMLRRDGLVPA